MSRAFLVGGGDHLDAAYSTLTLPFTISGWIKLTTLAANHRLVTYGTPAVATSRYTLGVDTTNAPNAVHADAGVATATATGTTPSDALWHNVVSTFTSVSARSAFLDGINKGSNATAQSAITPSVLRISGAPDGTNVFRGLAAHIAIWNGVVSDADIAKLATLSPNMVRPDILWDYWPLQSNSASEPSYGSQGTILTVTGTTFSTDDPVLNAGVIQPMYFNRKQLIFV